MGTTYKSHVVPYMFILNKIRDWCFDLSLKEKVWVTELASIVTKKPSARLVTSLWYIINASTSHGSRGEPPFLISCII